MGFHTLKWINIISYLYLLVASFILAGDIGGGVEEYVYVMPSGYAFSIWGVIYILLGLLLIAQFTQKEAMEQLVTKIGLWFPLSMVLSGTAVTVGTTPAFFYIVASLVTLSIVYTKIQHTIYRSTLYRFPFSLYLGWTSIATIVDAFIIIYSNGISEIAGLNQLEWAVIMLSAGGVIAILFQFSHHDRIFPIVFIWGYVAIIVEQNHSSIIWTTGIVIVVLVFLIGWGSWKEKNRW
ncbi:hypothetical protein [Pontibacillus yanchengensis]|uniref:Transporter n=1 Tax=Pontibacillus yanchengensis Y32 TaxID=1385514 RepID=A0A0A2TTX1_9BACI|nr:hypothetical protein [Pontibacillus yanchengensis]KGP72715.1 transporter [Pontibacillus yanchengensis Y32]